MCYSCRYGDPRPCTSHHHSSHRRAPAQQPQPAPLLLGECRRSVIGTLAAHRQLGQRGLHHHGVPQQLQRPAAQHQQPHFGLHHGLQLHGAWGLNLHRLQRPTLLPSTLQQPSGPGHSASREPQRCGAGAALISVRGLLSHSEGPGPCQPETTQPGRFHQNQPRAGAQGQHLQQEEPGEQSRAALQASHPPAGQWASSRGEVQDDGASGRSGQPPVRDIRLWKITGLALRINSKNELNSGVVGSHWHITDCMSAILFVLVWLKVELKRAAQKQRAWRTGGGRLVIRHHLSGKWHSQKNTFWVLWNILPKETSNRAPAHNVLTIGLCWKKYLALMCWAVVWLLGSETGERTVQRA